MSKKVIILSTSPRNGGNSELLANAFAKGAEEAGNQVEIISLSSKRIEFCRGCLACQQTKKCVINDDASLIAEKLLHADVVVFSTPIYFYEMCGQMKTMLDRTNPLFPAEYQFRDIYLLATSADEDIHSMDGAIKGLEGWISCFDKAKLKGVVCGTGAEGIGDIKSNYEALKKATDMGRIL